MDFQINLRGIHDETGTIKSKVYDETLKFIDKLIAQGAQIDVATFDSGHLLGGSVSIKLGSDSDPALFTEVS